MPDHPRSRTRSEHCLCALVGLHAGSGERPTGHACGRSRPPASALGVATQSLTLLLQQKLVADIERLRDLVDLRVLPPLCPLTVSPVDFSQTAALITQAHELTAAWLDRRDWATPIGLPAPHRH